MRAFAGDECVHAFIRRQFQTVTRAAGHDPDAPADFRTAGNDSRFRAGRARELRGEFLAGNPGARLKTYGLAVGDEKRPQIFQPERGAKLRVVAEPGMRIERQVRTVNRQVVFHQQPEQLIFFARPRMRRRPEQSVMDDEQIRFGGDGEFHGGEAGVHRRRDARDSAGVPGLQAIDRAVVIADFFGAEQNDRSV